VAPHPPEITLSVEQAEVAEDTFTPAPKASAGTSVHRLPSAADAAAQALGAKVLGSHTHQPFSCAELETRFWREASIRCAGMYTCYVELSAWGLPS
jgi:hypothetical protein